MGEDELGGGVGPLLEEGRDALHCIQEQLHAASRRVTSLQQRLSHFEKNSRGQDGAEGARSKFAADVAVDTAAPDGDFQVLQKGCCQASGPAGDVEDSLWPCLRDRLLQLHAEHEHRVQTMHAEHEVRLLSILPQGGAAADAGGRSPRGVVRVTTQSGVSAFADDAPPHHHQPGPEQAKTLNRGQSMQSMQSRSTVQSSDFANWKDSAQFDAMPVRTTSTTSKMSKFSRKATRVFSASYWEKRRILELVSGVMIVLSIFWMAFDVDFSMRNLVEGKESPSWVWIGDGILTVLFCVELVARLYVYGREFFSWRELPWNLLNMVIVGTDLMDLFMRVYSPSILRTLRVVRFVRILRVVRALRVVRELRVMLASIFCCFVSLSWALILLFLVMLMSAMLLMQTVQTQLDSEGLKEQSPLLVKYYGCLSASMMSICMAITGGMNWADLVEPLKPISPLYTPAFALFMSFVMVGILNVLAAIFVESTHRIAEVDSDLAISEEYDREEADCKMIRAFFDEADLDRDGLVTKEEFELKMQEARCAAELRTLDLDAWTVRGMFRLLNMTEEGVEVDALVYGLMRLRGSAKAIDMAMLLYENKRSQGRLRAKVQAVEHSLRDLKSQMLPDGGGAGSLRRGSEYHVESPPESEWPGGVEDSPDPFFRSL